MLHETAAIPYGATAKLCPDGQAGWKPAGGQGRLPSPQTPCRSSFPCHRVLRSDGAVGSLSRWQPDEESLLKMERERTAARLVASSRRQRATGYRRHLLDPRESRDRRPDRETSWLTHRRVLEFEAGP